MIKVTSVSPDTEFHLVLTFSNGELRRFDMRPYMDLRGGLLQGLRQEQKLGVNPFKFGFVGSSDIHNSLASFEEDNFFGNP